MTPERWKQVQAIFNDALDHAPSERAAFIASACGDDDQLRSEVEALLEADANPAPLFDSPPAALADDPAESVGSQPETVGAYRLLREIGRGGMGAVYLAERADGQFDRQVALKLVKRGMDTDEILRRFRNERQILAGLEHPNVARLHDGGVTETSGSEPGGRPYLVMEYVDGIPIDRYCDEHNLSVDGRLALFETVCEAVQYAHQNLIVHRDLKPSNILVSDDASGNPQVKLLDFGIAKLLSDDHGFSAPVTRTGVRVMTPEYASPEQIRGVAITTATDVYALGVILYELLTGRRPHEMRDGGLSDFERRVLETDPNRPSDIAPARFRKRLEGELDLIVLKALRKETERRYASAEALLEDLRRHDDGLPVSARPDTLGYRTRKFVRRHRFGVTVAAAFAALLIGTASLTAIQQAATARERDRAELERDKAEEVATFLEDLFNASDPFLASVGRLDTMRVRELLDRGAAKIQGELSNEPALQAQMLNVIGNVYRNLGLYETAVPMLRQALEKRRILYGPDHPDVAESLQSLAEAYQSQSVYDSAEALYKQAVAIYGGDRRDGDATPADLARSLAGLGSVLRDQNDFDEAEQVLKSALAIQEDTYDRDHLDVATSKLELGRIFQDRGNLHEAESLYVEVLAMHRRLLGSDHPEVAGSLDNLAIVFRQQGELDSAEGLAREALEIRERILGPEHPHTVTSMYELASILRDRGDFEPALDLFDRVYRLDREALGENHHYVGLDLREIGLTYLRMKRYDDALESYEASLEILGAALPPDHADVLVVMSGIGNVHLRSGDAVRAEPILREVVERRSAALGDNSWWTGISRSLLGECLMRLGRLEEAEAQLLEGYATLREAGGPQEAALRRLVEFYEMVEQPDRASEYRSILDANPT